MIRLLFILLIIFITIYIIYKYFPKIRLLLNKVLKSPFIFIILRNLIRLIMRRFWFYNSNTIFAKIFFWISVEPA